MEKAISNKIYNSHIIRIQNLKIMSTFNITGSTLNTSYEYKDENIIVQGSFAKGGQSGNLQSIKGTAYRNVDGQMGGSIGFFNGYPSGEEITYDLSQMSRKDSNLVWDAIDEIEAYALGENEGE